MSVFEEILHWGGDAGGRAFTRAGFGVMVAPLLVVFERWEGLVIRLILISVANTPRRQARGHPPRDLNLTGIR